MSLECFLTPKAFQCVPVLWLGEMSSIYMEVQLDCKWTFIWSEVEITMNCNKRSMIFLFLRFLNDQSCQLFSWLPWWVGHVDGDGSSNLLGQGERYTLHPPIPTVTCASWGRERNDTRWSRITQKEQGGWLSWFSLWVSGGRSETAIQNLKLLCRFAHAPVTATSKCRTQFIWRSISEHKPKHSQRK